MTRRAIRVLIALSMLVVGTGCATSYKPPADGRARLVIRGGALSVHRNDVVQAINQDMTGLFACDEQAQAFAASAFDDLSSGQALVFLGALLTPAFGIGIPFLVVGINRQQTGLASITDAVNRSNDSPRCRKGAP